MSKVEMYLQVRRACRVDGMSARCLPDPDKGRRRAGPSKTRTGYYLPDPG